MEGGEGLVWVGLSGVACLFLVRGWRSDQVLLLRAERLSQQSDHVLTISSRVALG
jgi:hypothetical protein